jgi:hypothetical protein
MRLGLILLGYQPQDMPSTNHWLAMTPPRDSKKTGVLSLHCSPSGLHPWTTQNEASTGLHPWYPSFLRRNPLKHLPLVLKRKIRRVCGLIAVKISLFTLPFCLC